MSFASLTPNILQQEFAEGDTCSGAVYSADTEPYRGVNADPARGQIHRRTRPETGAVDGGKIDLATVREGKFSSLDSAWIRLPGVTNIAIVATDDRGIDYSVASEPGDTLILDTLTSWSLPPGWDLRVVASGSITGPGRITLLVGSWAQPNQYLPFNDS